MQPNARITQEVWRHYVATKSLPDNVLRDSIHRAWQRCDQAGASPFVMAAHELAPPQARALLQEQSDLIEAARPYMHALSLAAGQERHAAMLGNDKAIVLDVVGDEASVHGRERVPGPGALLSEVHAGANGIGSPLAEGGYIELVGPEHFIEGFHKFTCQGVPISGPAGETVGVLSTSVRRVEVSQRIREILFCAARGIEAELMRRRLLVDVQRLLENSQQDASLLEALEQDVIQLQGAARLRLEKAVRLSRGNRQPDALRLLGAATDLMARFQQQSQLWREMASADIGVPHFLDLAGQVAEIGKLLSTEAAMRGLELEILPTSGTIGVFADGRELRRTLFRTFLRAFEASRRGTTLQVEVFVDDAGAKGVVRFLGFPEAVLSVPLYASSTPAGSAANVEGNDEHIRR